MKAKATLDANDLDQAESLLLEARNKDIEAIKKQQEQLENRRLSAAHTFAQIGDLKMTRLIYTEAASHYKKAVELLPTSEMELRASYLHKWGYACWMDEDYDTGFLKRIKKGDLGLYRLIQENKYLEGHLEDLRKGFEEFEIEKYWK